MGQTLAHIKLGWVAHKPRKPYSNSQPNKDRDMAKEKKNREGKSSSSKFCTLMWRPSSRILIGLE